MLLAEVLKILAAQTEALGYRRTDLYEKLFQGILDEESFGLEDIVKQIFSGSRPLNSALMRELCGPEGFQHLCGNIQANLLTVVGNHSGLYEQLARLLTGCPYTKAALLPPVLRAAAITRPNTRKRPRRFGASMPSASHIWAWIPRRSH